MNTWGVSRRPDAQDGEPLGGQQDDQDDRRARSKPGVPLGRVVTASATTAK